MTEAKKPCVFLLLSSGIRTALRLLRKHGSCAGRHHAAIELLGISTVAGNQTVEKTTLNAAKIVHAAGPLTRAS